MLQPLSCHRGTQLPNSTVRCWHPLNTLWRNYTQWQLMRSTRAWIWLVTSSFCRGDNSMVAARLDPSSLRRVWLVRLTLPLHADAESNLCCWMERIWLVRLPIGIHSLYCTLHNAHTQGSFSQGLLLNFTRKGAPSPGSSMRTPTSHSVLHDSSSGKTSSLSFNDTAEQGIFLLADSFAKQFFR